MTKRGGKVIRWTSDENATLFRLHREGADWDRIAEVLLGRTADACKQRIQYSKRKAAAAKARDAYLAKKQAEPVAPPVLAPALPAVAVVKGRYGARRVSTHVLVIDADLRARIALQGLTAGLLGDPLPGRSALDEKRRGGA